MSKRCSGNIEQYRKTEHGYHLKIMPSRCSKFVWHNTTHGDNLDLRAKEETVIAYVYYLLVYGMAAKGEMVIVDFLVGENFE